MLMKVVLPAPFWPTTARRSPGIRSKSIASAATTPPNGERQAAGGRAAPGLQRRARSCSCRAASLRARSRRLPRHRSTGRRCPCGATNTITISTRPSTSCHAPVSSAAAYSLTNSNTNAPMNAPERVPRAPEDGDEHDLARPHPIAHLRRHQTLRQREQAAAQPAQRGRQHVAAPEHALGRDAEVLEPRLVGLDRRQRLAVDAARSSASPASRRAPRARAPAPAARSRSLRARAPRRRSVGRSKRRPSVPPVTAPNLPSTENSTIENARFSMPKKMPR